MGGRRRFVAGVRLAALAGLAFMLTGCAAGSTSGQAAASPAPSTVPVLASTNVYGSVAAAIGGDRVKVTSIIDGPAADPHAYEATPSDAAKAAEAKIVVMNGGGYDEFVPRLVSAGGSNPKVIDAVALSGLDPETGTGAEHVWYSLPTIKKVATQLATDLAAADPSGAGSYAANLAAFDAKIAGLQAKVDAIRTAHPGARAAATEPVPGYLLEAAGLKDETPAEFAGAVEQETDPSVAALAEMLKLFQPPDPVRLLVVNAQTETPVTMQVERAAAAGGVAAVRMTETLPPGSGDYSTWMGQQIDALATELSKT